MKQMKRLLIPAMAFNLLSTPALWAVEGEMETMEEVTPTYEDYQNAVQAERAAYLSGASITDQEVTDIEVAASADATTVADKAEQEYANDEADQQVKEISRNHAISTIDPSQENDYHNAADSYALNLVEKTAHDYAITKGDEGSTEYMDAYDAAIARATDPSFENLYDTAYREYLDDNLTDNEFDAWQDAYDYAFKRATGDGYTNFRMTAYNEALKEFQETYYSDIYGDAYDEALAKKMAELSGQRNQLVYEMRFIKKYGWGRITRELGLPAKYNGVGQWRKGMPAPKENVAAPIPEELSISEEIELATKRNTRTGWTDDPQFQVEGNKNKGNKKSYGLARTTGLASGDVRGNSNKGGSGKDKSSLGNSGKKGSTVSAQSTASGKSKNNNGNRSKDTKSNNGNKGGNKGGNSSNKGGNNGNKGGNGKNK